MPQSDELPFMSVVLCAYNAEQVIARAIECLLKQDYPSERYEVIVVDDGSVDRTRPIAERYPVRVVSHAANQGLAAARNTGLAHMRGDIYVSFDDDCEVGTHWLRDLAAAYQLPHAAGIGSFIQDPPALRGLANRFMAASGHANSPPLRYGTSKSPFHRFTAYILCQILDNRPAEDYYQVRHLYGATATFPVQILRAVSGWDSSLFAAEDLDICQRIIARFPQLHFYIASSARVIHNPQLSVRKFLRRPYARGVDTLKYYRRNGLVPPIFPFPLAWLVISVSCALVNSYLGLAAALLLPQAFYVWWAARAIQERSFWPFLYVYVQLGEELATIAGLIRGRIVLRKATSLGRNSARKRSLRVHLTGPPDSRGVRSSLYTKKLSIETTKLTSPNVSS